MRLPFPLSPAGCAGDPDAAEPIGLSDLFAALLTALGVAGLLAAVDALVAAARAFP